MFHWSLFAREVVAALAEGGDVGCGYEPRQLVDELEGLVVVRGASSQLADLALTAIGRRAANEVGVRVPDVHTDAQRLAEVLSAAQQPRGVVALASGVGWGVQRTVSAGDLLVTREQAAWTVIEPATSWRLAQLSMAPRERSAPIENLTWDVPEPTEDLLRATRRGSRPPFSRRCRWRPRSPSPHRRS